MNPPKQKVRARDLFPYLWGQIHAYRTQVLLGILATVISVALDQVSPHLIGVLIDGLRSGWGQKEILNTLAWLLAAAFLSAGLLWAQRYLVIRASRSMEHDIRLRLFTRLQKMPPAFFDTHPTGTLMTLASSDLDRVRDVLGPAILHLFRTSLFVVYSVAYLAWRDWRLAAWAFLPLLAMPFVANKAMAAMHAAYARIQGRLSDLSNFTHDALSGIGVVKGFGREETFGKRMEELSGSLRVAQARSAWSTGAMWPAVTALGGLGVVILLWKGSSLVSSGHTTVGTLATCVMVFYRLQWPLIGLGWVSNMLQRGATSLGRLRDLETDMDKTEREEKTLSISHLPAPRATPVRLEVRNLHFRHHPDRPPALSGVSFVLEPGEGLGLAGGPGSGKTTLLQLVCGLRRPPPGTIFLDKQDLSELDPAEIARHFSLVPQDGFLFSDTIEANLRMGRPDDQPWDPTGVLAASCFEQDLPQIPGGLQALLGERGINLSGGQRQRLSLARALAKEAPFLLLDDTLSAVDAATEDQILARLGAYLSGRTLVLASHRYSAFRFTQRILVLQGGSVTESGSHEELLQKEGYYAEAWRLQALEREISEA